MNVRRPAVAGLFYPADTRQLADEVDALLRQSAACQPSPPGTPALETYRKPGRLEALIAPHAGYVYSGPVAASAYTRTADASPSISRIVLAGPAHHVPFHGVAVPTVDAFATPLGEVAVDAEARERFVLLPGATMRDDAHADEHSLEVHLPFLQRTLDEFSFLPIVVGDARPELVAGALDSVWTEGTLLIVSSDLSHFLDYESARRTDARTARAIEELQPDDIKAHQACGAVPVRALLHMARRRRLKARTLDLRNSGDTAGSRGQVVGYGAFAFESDAAHA
jgi:AmmeMemoRadiSam system protein B